MSDGLDVTAINWPAIPRPRPEPVRTGVLWMPSSEDLALLAATMREW